MNTDIAIGHRARLKVTFDTSATLVTSQIGKVTNKKGVSVKDTPIDRDGGVDGARTRDPRRDRPVF